MWRFKGVFHNAYHRILHTNEPFEAQNIQNSYDSSETTATLYITGINEMNRALDHLCAHIG